MSLKKNGAAICGIALIVIVLAAVAPESGSSRLVSVRQLNTERVAGQKCARSINDTGPNARPLFKIPVRMGKRASQLGIAPDPAHQEVFVATGEGNQIRTYTLFRKYSEIRDDWTSPTGIRRNN